MRCSTLQSAQKQVEVARSSVELANEALSEAQQRYANGVSDNLAVSQAQQSVAQANDQYVASLYRDNVAKLSLARALGAGRITRAIWEGSERGGNNHNTSSNERGDERPRSRSRGPAAGASSSLWLPSLWWPRLGFWWHSTFSEDTDDAQINGHLIQISSRIAGQVIKVYVEENQMVKKGDLIAELDPRDYQVAVENAKAALASAQANAAAANVNVPLTTINTGSNLSSASADVSGAHAQVLQAQGQLAGGTCAGGAGTGQ